MVTHWLHDATHYVVFNCNTRINFVKEKHGGSKVTA